MEETFVYLTRECLWLILFLSLPPIGVATIVGLIVSLLQALTQIQEQTLGFAVKLIAILLTLLFLGSWFAGQLLSFGKEIFSEFRFLLK